MTSPDERGELPPSLFLDTGLYDYALGVEHEHWEAEWAREGSEAEEFGFGSFVYRRDTPLDRARFMALFDDWPDAVVRAKGFVTFAKSPLVLVSVVRDTVELTVLPPAEGGEGDDIDGTELVFIGRSMDAAAIRRRLDGCLAGAGLA